MPPPLILAIDQGTTSSRAVVYDAGHVRRRSARPSRRSSSTTRATGGSNTSRKTSGTRSPARCREALANAGRPGRGRGRRRHHQPARNGRRCGTAPPAGRSTGRSSGRTAAPPTSAASGAADQPWLTAKTGLVLDPYFSGTKLRWLLENDPDLQAARPSAANWRRHRRLVPHLAAHRRGGPRHRRHQRQPHAAVQHPHDAVGRRAAAATSACRGALLPDGEAQRRRLRRHEGAGLPAGRRADPRRGGRPAGGAVRPGRVRPRRGEMHLRHRRVLPAAHR